MNQSDERIVTVFQSDKNRGCFDCERFENPNPNDTEERIVISREDIEVTKRELRRRMTPKAS